MEDKEPKKINDELITFMKKRSESEVPRYSERLKNYVTIQQRRAAAAKRALERRSHSHRSREAEGKDGESVTTYDCVVSDRDQQGNDDGGTGRGVRRGRTKEITHSGGRTRSGSASVSGEQQDRCGRRRRRRRRRRRSCGRRRRRSRRRSCRRRKRRRRRRSCRRRRRRSCSRRRRRRSCRRRRKRCRGR